MSDLLPWREITLYSADEPDVRSVWDAATDRAELLREDGARLGDRTREHLEALEELRMNDTCAGWYTDPRGEEGEPSAPGRDTIDWTGFSRVLAHNPMPENVLEGLLDPDKAEPDPRPSRDDFAIAIEVLFGRDPIRGLEELSANDPFVKRARQRHAVALARVRRFLMAEATRDTK